MLANFNYEQIKAHIESLGYEVKDDIYLCEIQHEFMLSVRLDGEGLQTISRDTYQQATEAELFCFVSETNSGTVRFDFFEDFDTYNDYVIDAYLWETAYKNLGLYWFSKQRKTPLAVSFTALLVGHSDEHENYSLDVHNFGEIKNGKVQNRAVWKQASNRRFSEYKFFEGYDPEETSKHTFLESFIGPDGDIDIMVAELQNLLELVLYEKDESTTIPTLIPHRYPRYYTSIQAIEEAALNVKRDPENADYGVGAKVDGSLRLATVDVDANTVEWEGSLTKVFNGAKTRWINVYEEGLK